MENSKMIGIVCRLLLPTAPLYVSVFPDLDLDFLPLPPLPFPPYSFLSLSPPHLSFSLPDSPPLLPLLKVFLSILKFKPLL